MSNVVSALAAAQLLALSRGPARGAANGQVNAANLRILSEKATLPVEDLTSSEYVRFGIIPKGSKIVPSLCCLSSNHSAAIPGKIQLVPLSGATVQEITGVTVLLENTPVSGNSETPVITSVPDVADDLVVAEDSWVQFVPTSTTTIASTAKTMRARITYASLI